MSEGELPSWMSSKSQKKRQNRRSAKHERDLARESGGRVTAGSGSSWRAPQDVSTDTHLIQHKYTDAASYRVSDTELSILEGDAARAGKEWALVINFERSGRRITITDG